MIALRPMGDPRAPVIRPCVTGVGVVTPIGADIPSFWDAMLKGASGARPVRSFDTSTMTHHVGCEAPEVDLPIPMRASVLGGRCSVLALGAVAEALGHAGLTPHEEGPTPHAGLAVVVGTTMGDVAQFERDRAAHPDRAADDADVAVLARRPLDVMARSIARVVGAAGPVITVPAACAAGAYAIGMAASLVSRGRAQIAIAVGAEAFSRLAFVGFTRLHAMSSDQCRPFSLGRPGLLLGEGAGALIIESPESARRRGAAPLGFVDGFGLSCDAHHITGPHPEGRGAARAMTQALARAGLDPSRIDYINAHGTGTPMNDKTEALAIRSVFAAHGRPLPVSSIKALTGHMMGAAGAVEAIACLLAMRDDIVPPTWNWVEPDPECDLDCVPNAPRSAELRRVLSNSYAFGGNNASLLLTSPKDEWA